MTNSKRITGKAYLLLFTILISALLFSCRSTKKIQTAISKKDTSSITSQSAADSILSIKKTMEVIKKSHIDFTTFSSKIKVEYESKGKQQNLTAYVHILKDSLIWVSIYATVFNIEAFRVLIRKDSVFVLDKLNKEAQLRSLDYLQEITEIPFDFKTLQDLIIGNPIYMDTSAIIAYKKTEDKTLLSTAGKYFKHLLTLNNESNSIIHSKLDDVDITRNRTADITYGEYENTTGFRFSTYREITVSEKNKLDIRLNIKQYEFNKELSISFSIPKNYKRS